MSSSAEISTGNETPAHFYRVGWFRTLVNAAFIASFFALSISRFVPLASCYATLPLIMFGVILLYRGCLRVALYPDRLEVTNWGSKTTLRRDEIAGFRLQSGRRDALVLELKHGQLLPDGSAALSIPRALETDAAWDAWIGSMPNLAKQDHEALLADIQAATELGRSPASRLRRWRLATATAWGAWIATGMLVLLPLFGEGPRDVALAGLVAMPWIALSLVAAWARKFSRGGTSLSGPMLALLCLVPVPGLPLALLQLELPYHLLGPPAAIGEAAILFAALLAAAVLGVRRDLSYAVVATCSIVLFSAFYCYSAVCYINYRLDAAPAQPYSTTIMKKVVHNSVNRGQATTSYEIVLDAWGPKGVGTTASGIDGAFATRSPGDAVCIDLHPGALGLAWYQIDLSVPLGGCPEQNSRSG